jgi:YesN/AraC family two-component response regulator
LPTIPRTLVNEYIKAAKPLAESDVERIAVRMAMKLNSPSKHRDRARNPRRIPEMHFAVDKPEVEAQKWRELILAEIHTALCTQSNKYKQYTGAIRDSGSVLIGMIASKIAGEVGAAFAVVGALVAALLRMVCEMGISVFCRRFKSGFL